MMTSTYQDLALNNENRVKNITTMNAIALMVFLLLFLTSTLVHAQHIAVNSDIVEQQECHICYHSSDMPPVFPEIQVCTAHHYMLDVNQYTATLTKTNNFVQPPLRAPPVT